MALPVVTPEPLVVPASPMAMATPIPLPLAMTKPIAAHMAAQPIQPFKLSLSSPKVISYYDMQERLLDLGLFKYDKILSDDQERSVCIFAVDSKKYVMKLGNRADRDDTTKFHLLKKEAAIYKELQNFPEDSRFFPKLIRSGEIDAEFYYIIIEYVEGKTLYDYLNEKKPGFNDSKEVLTIMLNLTMALNALWSHGIVHGDLSVENVMIEPNLNVKLIDFEKSAKHSLLKLNTVGTSRLSVNSRENAGFGYFFLLRISLSVLKNRETHIPFLHAIKSVIEACNDCNDVYYNCARIIESELGKISGTKASANASGGAKAHRSKTRKACNTRSARKTSNAKKASKLNKN